MKTLIAGLGNIFRGDDAFGVEVVKQLRRREWPADVDVVDIGINGIDLTYALLDDYDKAILIDALRRDGVPGTLYIIEPEPAQAATDWNHVLTPHALDPGKVVATVAAMHGRCRKVTLIGCEPAEFGDEYEGQMGLSAPVAGAVSAAARLAARLVGESTRRRGDQRSSGKEIANV